MLPNLKKPKWIIFIVNVRPNFFYVLSVPNEGKRDKRLKRKFIIYSVN